VGFALAVLVYVGHGLSAQNQHSKNQHNASATIGAKGSILTRFIKPTQVLPMGIKAIAVTS
jgi:hypothetical protein